MKYLNNRIIDMDLTSEIRYLEFNNVFEFRNFYKHMCIAGADIIHYGRHKYKEEAFIIVFYWNYDK